MCVSRFLDIKVCLVECGGPSLSWMATDRVLVDSYGRHLYVSLDASASRCLESGLISRLLHLLDEILRLSAFIECAAGFDPQHKGGHSEDHAGNHGHRKAPVQHVEAGIHQPVPAICVASKHSHGQEHEHG